MTVPDISQETVSGLLRELDALAELWAGKPLLAGAADTCLRSAATIRTLRAELAEAKADREQTIRNWENDIRAMNSLRDDLRAQLATATRKVEVLTEGLEFYACYSSWESDDENDRYPPVDSDLGDTARDTLARADAVGKEEKPNE